MGANLRGTHSTTQSPLYHRRRAPTSAAALRGAPQRFGSRMLNLLDLEADEPGMDKVTLKSGPGDGPTLGALSGVEYRR